MLKLVNITKEYYLKDQEPIRALKGINLTFRDNEFVAILGPSGCGKTTLLNITGGLDRYTTGDLIIQNKSTKQYKDSDWDTYRNHSIGFVFQSYNLISHQSVLKNVELALTISGVSRKERRKRALEALQSVGLKGLENNKPSQMSGGQMQRVAIARALVNNPEIVMADEPTGALDSETSVQVMDILKEVAKDRLVIMVTHNPELATKYATRIVKMKDGLVISDSNPCNDDNLVNSNKVDKSLGKKSHSSMGIFTALGLSFSNLLSKIKRTILVTIAGSIGIIGVSAVLAVSQGVSDYIDSMQDDMLSSYPITISEQSIDYTALVSGLSNWEAKEIPNFDISNEVGLDSMIEYLMKKYSDFTQVKTNDINENLLNYIEDAPNGYYSSIGYDYGIDPTNNIFTEWKRSSSTESKKLSINGLTQMYISELMTVDGFGMYAKFVDLFTGFMKQLPDNGPNNNYDYILNQYDLLGNSRMPSNENQMVIVTDENQTLTDLLYAQLGFYNQDEFINLALKAVEDVNETSSDSSYVYPETFSFNDILGKTFTYYNHDDIYSFQTISEETTRFTLPMLNQQNPSNPTLYEFTLVYNEDCDCLIGEVSISTGGSVSCVFTRSDATPSDPSINEVGTWNWKATVGTSSVDFTFKLDSTYNVILTKMGDTAFTYPCGTYTVTTEDKQAYMYDASNENLSPSLGTEMTVVGILKRKPSINFGCLDRGIYYTSDFTKKYINNNKTSNLIAHEDSDVTKDGIATYIKVKNGNESKPFEAYVKYTYTSFIKGEGEPIQDVFGYANCINATGIGASISTMMTSTSVDAFESDKLALRSLGGLGVKEFSQGSMTSKLITELPQSISIYPSDFDMKDKLTSYLDTWNKNEDITLSDGVTVILKDDREELTYTDTIEMIINVINTLIVTITIALVAFTSLALVVSCFMIAVITYISVVERVKEIGIIRSVGGRKKDVSRLFIAETFITGLSSGIFGLGVTYIFELIFNIVMNKSFAVNGLANLTIPTALIMLAISIILSVLSGLIPSYKASKQDPVIALRGE